MTIKSFADSITASSGVVRVTSDSKTGRRMNSKNYRNNHSHTPHIGAKQIAKGLKQLSKLKAKESCPE